MSGGSYDYAEHKLRDLATSIRMQSSCVDNAARKRARNA